MKFEDVTVWDLNLIKSKAIHLLTDTKINSRYEALAIVVVACIEAKGFNLQNKPNNLTQILVKYLTPIRKDRETEKHPPTDDVIMDIFEYLKDNNIVLIKDENRECTWNQPTEHWHNPVVVYKLPWIM